MTCRPQVNSAGTAALLPSSFLLLSFKAVMPVSNTGSSCLLVHHSASFFRFVLVLKRAQCTRAQARPAAMTHLCPLLYWAAVLVFQQHSLQCSGQRCHWYSSIQLMLLSQCVCYPSFEQYCLMLQSRFPDLHSAENSECSKP